MELKSYCIYEKHHAFVIDLSEHIQNLLNKEITLSIVIVLYFNLSTIWIVAFNVGCTLVEIVNINHVTDLWEEVWISQAHPMLNCLMISGTARTECSVV